MCSFLFLIWDYACLVSASLLRRLKMRNSEHTWPSPFMCFLTLLCLYWKQASLSSREDRLFAQHRCWQMSSNSALSCNFCATLRRPGDKMKLLVCEICDSLCTPGLLASLSSGLFTKTSVVKDPRGTGMVQNSVWWKCYMGPRQLCLLLTLLWEKCSWQPSSPWTWPTSCLAVVWTLSAALRRQSVVLGWWSWQEA